jgi:NADH dehydrogenase [ubiquinone] 1 alpha subcomplex assembly factor 5
MNGIPRLFDRAAIRRNRDRAARDFAAHDVLLREAVDRLVDRLDDIARPFAQALVVGSHGGLVARALAGRPGLETVIETDLSSAMLGRRGIVADAEFLPFAGGLDLAVSCLSLHAVNDLPGALIQLRAALKPDGLLLASLYGPDTLHELREALLDAEIEISGGASPRVSPFVDVRDAGALLQRAGFALPVVDSDTLTIRYANALDLMHDLRGMGEANALAERRRNFTRRDILLRAASLYEERYKGDDGRVPATFQFVTMTAWAPHASQPKPLRPGSAAARLADALGSSERPAGEKTGR